MTKEKKNIAIVGPNKKVNSAIGKIIADELEMKFLDTDGYIEYIAGVSNALLISDYGADFYMQMESKEIKNLANFDNSLICTSTSTIMRVENIKTLSKFSYVILLVSDEDKILDRLLTDGGVVLKEEFLAKQKEIFASIRGEIRRLADIVVDTNTMPPLKIAKKIITAILKLSEKEQSDA